jgi:nucleotide-binding universal stress UspA family protein
MSDSTISTARKAVGNGILAGYDGSAVARHAALWAAAEAHARGRPLILARAYERPMWTDVERLPDDARAWHCDHSLRVLAEECRAAYPELNVRCTTRAGHPGPVLAALADKVDAELVVIGSRGYGPIARLVLGSTAADLTHVVNRPVVVVRGAVGPGPVLLGLAGTDGDGPAIEFAFDQAARLEAPLHAVHGDHHPRAPEALEKVLAPWRERYPAVRVHTEVVRGKPASALLERSAGARLLVVGTHHHGTAHRMLHGSISHAAVYHAECPVAVVPAGRAQAVRQPTRATATNSA